VVKNVTSKLFRAVSLFIPIYLAAQSASQPRLSADGWSALKIGMTLAEADRAIGARLARDNSASGSNACVDAWVGSRSHPMPPLQFRFVDGRLAVIELRDNSIATDKGIRIGDPESKVVAAYRASLKREPAPYYEESDPQHRLFLWLSPNRGLLFEIDDKGKVAHIAAGTSQLNAIEGCA